MRARPGLQLKVSLANRYGLVGYRVAWRQDTQFTSYHHRIPTWPNSVCRGLDGIFDRAETKTLDTFRNLNHEAHTAFVQNPKKYGFTQHQLRFVYDRAPALKAYSQPSIKSPVGAPSFEV